MNIKQTREFFGTRSNAEGKIIEGSMTEDESLAHEWAKMGWQVVQRDVVRIYTNQVPYTGA